jgi:hypothetical protein
MAGAGIFSKKKRIIRAVRRMNDYSLKSRYWLVPPLSGLPAPKEGLRGSDKHNVWRMRQFYRDYTDGQFLAQFVRELTRQENSAPKGENLSQLVREMVATVPWGHHANALAKLSDPTPRPWYLQATARFGWSRNVLLNQIKAGAYERAVMEKKTHNFP